MRRTIWRMTTTAAAVAAAYVAATAAATTTTATTRTMATTCARRVTAFVSTRTTTSTTTTTTTARKRVQFCGRGRRCFVSAASKQRQQRHLYSSTSSGNRGTDRKDAYDARRRRLADASKLSLAPMMEYTDRHFRHVVRLVSRRTLLYTEMVAANALCHERRNAIQEYLDRYPNRQDDRSIRRGYAEGYLKRYLSQGRVEPLEGPSVLQLGGSDPEQLYEAAQTVMDMTDRGLCDYTAINLNCGCPSPKVAGKGCFGAALMERPVLVKECTQAVYEGCGGRVPVTVKCRIGTDAHCAFHKRSYRDADETEEYRRLCRFVETVASNGVVTDFQIHARIAVLQKSFSPADNRSVPPLKYRLVRRLVQDYSPHLTFTLNGGIETLAQARREFEACPGLTGVMVGRAWAADPWSFAMTDPLLYGDDGGDGAATEKNRFQILEEYGKHADYEESVWDPIKVRRFIVKAIQPLFAGEPNAKRYRIALDEIAGRPKRLALEGRSLDGEPPISELIMNAASHYLSEETLLRTPQESYEKQLWEERKWSNEDGNTPAGEQQTPRRSLTVAAWQTERKQQQQQQQEQEANDARMD